jgi:1,2-diacylglycerol 3-alpha-glucosyltransferase
VRILMISDVYFPRVNGVSTSIQTFATEFHNHGHEVTLIAPDYGTPHQEPFEIIRIPSRVIPVDPEDRMLNYREITLLSKTLAGRGFDIVHIQTPFIAHYAGLKLARTLGIPAVISYHTYFEEYLDKYISLILRLVARHFSRSQCNKADALVVPSSAMLKVLRSYGITTGAEVIPTGIQLAQFKQGNATRFLERHGIDPARQRLVHVGRLAEEKNIHFLINALSHKKSTYSDVLLIIAGEGPAKKALEQQAMRLGLRDNVLFTGYLDRNGPLQDCYSAGNAFIFSSLTETQGLVLLEAMSLGIPLVSLAEMGTRDVLAGNDGALIAEYDIEDFSARTIQLLRDPGLHQEMSVAAKSAAENWSAPVMAKMMVGYYQTIIDRKCGASLSKIIPSQQEQSH